MFTGKKQKMGHCEFNPIIWGKHSYGAPERRGNANKIVIGNYTCIAENCVLDSGFQHRTDFISNYPFHRLFHNVVSNCGEVNDIVIGNDVWIGEDVMIFHGAYIGDGAVIGAKSLITKNTEIKPYEIWAGTPARFIKKRFSDEIIEKLLELKWWNKSDIEIQQIAPLLMSNDFEELFKLYEV